MSTRQIDPSFTLLCVRTNPSPESKNKFSVDVETVLGILPAVIRRKSNKVHLATPLSGHPARKAIEKAVAVLVADLEGQRKIGEGAPPLFRLCDPSPDAVRRTEATEEALRQYYAAKAQPG
jgi:hypothetical protein